MKLRQTYICTAFLVALVTSCGQKKETGEAPLAPPSLPHEEPAVVDTTDSESRLRGYVEISQIIEASITQADGDFSIASYVGGTAYGDPGLALLMGYYDNNPVAPGWRNASANTMNLAVYMMAADALGRDIALRCVSDDEQSGINLKPEIEEYLADVCRNKTSASEETMRALWSAFTGRLVPESEFQPWLEAVKAQSSSPIGDLLAFMTTTTMLSPFYVFQN